MKHILIIDDDIYIGNMLNEVMTKEGYKVSRAYSGTEALLLLSNIKPDLILLDLMLPGMSGEELLKQINCIPVIIMSAKIDIDNKVDLLLSGAVDYITKPFNIKELMARVVVALRHAAINKTEILTFSDIKLNTLTHTVYIGDSDIKLTRTEYAILKILMMNPNQVNTKSILLDNISDDTPDCTESSLKIHIYNLRKKLSKIGGKEYIESVWGIGFKLTESNLN